MKIIHLSIRQQGLLLVLSLLAVISVFPFAVMILISSKNLAQITADFWRLPDPLQWENYFFGLRVTARYVLNSMVVSVAVCIGSLMVGSLAAFAFSRMNFPARKVLYSAVISLLFVPGVLMLIPLFVVVRELGLLDSYAGMILPQVAASIPLVVFLLKTFIDDLPNDFFDAARIDGATDGQILRNIVAPLCLPVLSTLTVLNILGSWNNYVWALVCIRDEALRTIPLGLAFLQTEENLVFQPGKMMAAYLVASIPMLLVFLLALKPFMNGMTEGAVKG